MDMPYTDAFLALIYGYQQAGFQGLTYGEPIELDPSALSRVAGEIHELRRLVENLEEEAA